MTGNGGGRTIPDGVNVIGIPGISEIDIGLNGSNMDTLFFAGNNIVENMIFSSPLSTPNTGANWESINDPVNFTPGELVEVIGDNFVANHSIFQDYAGQNLRITGNNAHLYHCKFEGGRYGLLFNGSNGNDTKIWYCYFNYLSEGIKTIGGQQVALSNLDPSKTPDIKGTLFGKQIQRDSIDLTKGWRNLWIQGGEIRSGIDIKTAWNIEDEWSDPSFNPGGATAWDMLFDSIKFVMVSRHAWTVTQTQNYDPNSMTGTGAIVPEVGETESGAVTGLPDWLYFGPRGITIKDSIFELPVGDVFEKQLGHYKAGRDFVIENAILRNGLELAPNYNSIRDDRNFATPTNTDGWAPLSLLGYNMNISEINTTIDSDTPTPDPTYDQNFDPADPPV